MPAWAERQQALARLGQCQLFFVGGAPRSGTTWLQQILDSHADISCHGEGLFLTDLAEPLRAMMARRSEVLAAKNTQLFRHTGGHPLPAADDVEHLIGTAILLALHRQSAGKPCRAIGDKTPDNVFFFPRLKRLFPSAKFIGIARDPRDVLTSAWHFFRRTAVGSDEAAAKFAFIRSAMPALASGARAMLEIDRAHPADCLILTYDALLRTPGPLVAQLFRFLGVSDSAEAVSAALARTSFAAQAGRPAGGAAQNGTFFRRGVAGDWPSTLTPEMNALILHELGWMFPRFGWQP